jgi:hypothetical protein
MPRTGSPTVLFAIASAAGDAWISNSNDRELWRVSSSQP